MDDTILARLAALLEQRGRDRPSGSYTTALLEGGVEAIAAKLREETDELIRAAQAPKPEPGQVVHEAADLVYHLLVMLVHCGVPLGDVEAELARRFGTSGLAEKAARATKGPEAAR